MRLSLRILLIACTALALLLAAAVLARRELVEAVAERELRAAGFPEADVGVTAVATDHLVVGSLAFGPLRAEQVTLRYRPLALLQGELEGVEIASLTYDLTLPGESPGAGGDFELPPLPPVRIAAGRLNLTSPQGQGTLDFEAEAAQDAAGLIEGRARFSGRSDFGDFEGELAAAFAGQRPERLDLQLRSEALRLLGETLALEPLRLRLAEGAWSADAALSGAGLQARLELRTEALALPAELQLAASGELAAASPAWGRLGLPPPERGRLRIGLELGAKAEPQEDLPDSPAAWLQLATAAGLAGDARLELIETRWPGLPEPASLTLPVKLESRTEGLDLALPDALDLRGLPDLSPLGGDIVVATDLLKALSGATQLQLEGADGAAPSMTVAPSEDGGLRILHKGRLRVLSGKDERAALAAHSRVSLPPDLGSPAAEVEALELVVRDLRVAGEEVVEARITGRAAGRLTALNATGDLTARLRNAALDDFRFREVGLEAPFLLAAEGEQVVAEITDAGRLAWSGGVTGGQISLPAEHALTLSRITLIRRGPALTYSAELDPGALTLGVPQAEGEPVELRARFAPLEVEGGWSEEAGHELQARIPLREVAVPELGLIASGLTVQETYLPAQDRAELELEVTELRHGGDTAFFVPLALKGRLDHRSARLAFTGEAETTGSRKLATLQGWHDLDGETGSARIGLAEDLLAGGPLRLQDLAPAAPDFTLSEGEVAATAELTWKGAELQSTGRFALSALDIEGPDLSLKGLETSLAFDRLFPPRSAPGQSLRADAVTYVEPLTDVSAVFAVDSEADGSLAIDIERARASSQLGPLTVVEGRAVPQRDSYRLTLQIAGLDLARLSDSAAIEGLSGEGRLGGLIPLEIEGDRIRIRGARLTNLDQGVLKFRSETAASALAAGGEPVTLMLQALEDFHYEELKLEADSGDTQELELFVTTLGQNPKVLEGHPFRFNIRLTSNLPQLVEALRQGSGLTQGILGKLWKFQP